MNTREMKTQQGLSGHESLDWAVNDQVGLRMPETGQHEEHVGTIISMVVLTISLVLFMIWAETGPSFEACSFMPTLNARMTCYEQLRAQALTPPTKGAKAPVVPLRPEN